jgi:hypothetical protein
LEWTERPAGFMLARMGQVDRIGNCPRCGRVMEFVLLPGANASRGPQCLDCEKFDPLKSELVTGWLNGELGRAQLTIARQKGAAPIGGKRWFAP